MSVPSWAVELLRRLASSDRAEDLLGDLEEAHRRRIQHRNRWIAEILTRLEALDMALALLRGRLGRRSRPAAQLRREPAWQKGDVGRRASHGWISSSASACCSGTQGSP